VRCLFVLLLSLSLLLVSCVTRPPTATPTIPPESDPLNIPWEDSSVFKEGLVASEQDVLEELPGASAYRIDFHILDTLDEIKGAEQIRYTNSEGVSLSELWLRLFPNILGGEMTIDKLTVDGQPVEPTYKLEDSLMIVQLAAPLDRGQSLTLAIDFSVSVPRSLEMNYGVLAYAEEVLSLAHAYPMIAVYDDEGWNAEIPSQNGDVVYADMSFYIARVTAPSSVKVIASGRQVSHSQAGENQTLIFAAGPARDFYVAASPTYEETVQTFGEVTIRSYAPPAAKQGSQLAVDVARRAIENFSARYAPYPYTELDIVQTPTLALGIEYPGVINITSHIYNLEVDYRGTPTSVYLEATVAHEVGHQWFYNLVGDDQLDDPWLDESLTQFATLQYYADAYGPVGEQGFRSSLEGRWDSINRAEIPIGRPAEAYTGQEYSAIVYGRGPLFFVALRETMGAKAFDTFLREYTESYSWGIATPEALQSMAETHCACELDELFQEWVYP
jgi:aminopeptidase N